jgi:hypothetical protein
MRTQPLTPANSSDQIVTQPAPPESAAHSYSQLNNVDVFLSVIVIALPLLVILGVVGHKRHRASRLRQRVELLERLWKLNYRKSPKPPKSPNSGGV